MNDFTIEYTQKCLDIIKNNLVEDTNYSLILFNDFPYRQDTKFELFLQDLQSQNIIEDIEYVYPIYMKIYFA